MKKALSLLFVLFSLFAFAPAEAEVYPYHVVDIKKDELTSGGEMIRLIITTVDRDMSKMSGVDLAETVESAYQYVRKSPAGSLAKKINVLLFDIPHINGNCLAQATLNRNSRTLASIKGNGPTKRQLLACETIELLKGGSSRATTEADYAQAAKLLKMKKSATKKAHLDVAILASSRIDRSELIDSVPGLLPVFPDR